MSAEAYYGTVRRQVVDLCPSNVQRAFEVGCGYGSTLAWLQKNRNYQWIGGAEISSSAAAQARLKLNQVIEGDVEDSGLPLEAGSLDLLLCLDVLEHLRDPWSFLQKTTSVLKKGGVFIASLPNIRHHTVLFPLLFSGQFTYQNSGILDRTHLKLFTRSSAIELIGGAGIKVEQVLSTGLNKGSKSDYLNKISFGALEQFLAYQYIIKGVRID